MISEVDFIEVCRSFCTAQRENVQMLDEAELDLLSSNSVLPYPEFATDFFIFKEKLKQFLFEISQTGHISTGTTNFRVCEILNRSLLSKPDFQEAVRRLSMYFEKPSINPTRVEITFAKAVEELGRGIFEMSKCAKQAKRLPGIEGYQAGLALVKFTQMTDSRSASKSKIPYAYIDPWNAPLSSSMDVRITSTAAPKKKIVQRQISRSVSRSDVSGKLHSLKPTLPTRSKAEIELPEPLNSLIRLDAAIETCRQIITHFLDEQLKFAHLWHDFLGNNGFDFGYRSFIRKCQWQRQSSEGLLNTLVRIRLKTSAFLEELRSNAAALLQIDAEEFITILANLLFKALTAWYQQMEIGSSCNSWSDVVKYYEASIMATEFCLMQREDTFSGQLGAKGVLEAETDEAKMKGRNLGSPRL